MNFDISTTEGMDNSVEWTRVLLSQIREGGIWFVPRSVSAFVVSHENRTLTRVGHEAEPSIEKVAAAMNWRVIEMEET